MSQFPNCKHGLTTAMFKCSICEAEDKVRETDRILRKAKAALQDSNELFKSFLGTEQNEDGQIDAQIADNQAVCDWI